MAATLALALWSRVGLVALRTHEVLLTLAVCVRVRAVSGLFPPPPPEHAVGLPENPVFETHGIF